MAGEHPSDSTLFAYVEGELDGAERATVEAHLAACEPCAEDVRLARRGREGARATSLLEAPPGLAARFREHAEPSRGSGRRRLAVVAPLAAALAIAGGVATVAVLGGGGDEEGAGGGAVAEEGGALTGGAEDSGAGGEALSGVPTVRRVAADPGELAAELRAVGFMAQVEGSTVVVATRERAKLRRALADYPRGAVRVLVREP
ncbi:MAG TPA: anti-sigma factor [Gaiellaceae bacterium]|jgi:hypothetical protein|nr:anti-sigma factor [Gaiellaceae bacterium]